MTGIQKAAALLARKHAAPIAAITAYDFATARLLDETGADLLLVGDSLGMVVLGYPNTTHVTMAHMLHHVEAVGRAKPKALVVGDLPIHSYPDVETTLKNARALVAAGAEAVKLEGGRSEQDKVRAVVDAGIPVLGHLGMLPQHVLEEGGYKKKGKTPEQVTALLDDAQALVEAGVFGIVLESVIAETAMKVTEAIAVPTIGIGCGNAPCNGEVVVVTDLVGGFPWFVPPFARPEGDIASVIRGAADTYIKRVHA